MPSHYLNHCWNIVNSMLRNRLQWNFKRNSYIFIHENAFENGICRTVAILSKHQVVKLSSTWFQGIGKMLCWDILVDIEIRSYAIKDPMKYGWYFLYPLLQRRWKGGILVSPCPSVHLSVCRQNLVHSVSSTILIGSISYLHILSHNFSWCVYTTSDGVLRV